MLRLSQVHYMRVGGVMSPKDVRALDEPVLGLTALDAAYSCDEEENLGWNSNMSGGPTTLGVGFKPPPPPYAFKVSPSE